MNTFKRGRDLHYKNLLSRAVLLVITVSIITYFLPRGNKFNYQFDIDRPWKYGQLMATFDFPIYKSDQQVKLEQDSILAHFQPYFLLDKSVKGKAINKLKNDYRKHLRDAIPSESYLRYLVKHLSEIYDQGIIATEQLSKLREDSINGIMVIENKMANWRNADHLYSVKSAYTYLLQADPAQYKAEILRQCSLNEYIFPNLMFDEQRTTTAKEEILSNYSWAYGMVQSGQKIIDRGEIVTPQIYSILESLKKESAKRSDTIGQEKLLLIGQILIVGVLVICFMLYLEIFRKEFYQRKGSILLLFALILFYTIATSLMMSHNFLNVYIIPYAMLPMIVRVFLDSRTSCTTYTVTILLCSICLHYPFEFILLQMSAGMVAVYSLKELSQRSQIFRSAFLIGITYFTMHFALELLTENDLSKIDGSMFIYLGINIVLLLFTYPLLFMLEKTFGFTSNVTLVELSNINTPLLRQMSETVPGTFQHSMQVANLAAEAANHVHANSQLVRTGALYHDIGKMENPAFFTENQSGGFNPHKSLSYEQSAQIVISHITDGVKLAEKHNLPESIINFIRTHHGKGITKYFYISWKNEHPDEEANIEAFTYPGPNPFTKEQAILMMADSVEAASRSLPEYTEETIGALVDKIIDSQVNEGFFKECPITFLDIAQIKNVFKEKLRIIYHTRISYPELKK